MNPENFTFFSGLLKDRTGVVIGPDKAYLVDSRLSPVARKHGLADCAAVLAAIRTNTNLPLVRDCLNAMMTHESFFFRDATPFEQFRHNVLPELLKQRAGVKRLRIWCAAASTGQEPYSLAMILKEEASKLAGWVTEIVATDISPTALSMAREGLYTQFEAQRGLPIQLLLKYFSKENESWRIAPAIRDMVNYREFNLLNDPAVLGHFDVVFCRNVLIYFDQRTKGQILDRIANRLPADGRLYLGGAETVMGISDRFAAVPAQRGLYAPTASRPRASAMA